MKNRTVVKKQDDLYEVHTTAGHIWDVCLFPERGGWVAMNLDQIPRGQSLDKYAATRPVHQTAEAAIATVPQ